MDQDQDEDTLAQAALQQMQASGKRIAESNKEWFSAMTKYGKAVEKVRRQIHLQLCIDTI